MSDRAEDSWEIPRLSASFVSIFFQHFRTGRCDAPLGVIHSGSLPLKLLAFALDLRLPVPSKYHRYSR